MMTKVALVPCKSYTDNVNEKVKTAMELLGGIGQFVDRKERILIKPNVLSGVAPDRATTTHPAVFGAVCALLREHQYEHLQYGDSPGSPLGSVEKAMRTAGLAQEAEKYHIPQGNFSDGVTVRFPQGKVCKEFILCRAVENCDAIISLCKMKTHALENITGAVKNQYGMIYAANKAAGHAKYPTSRSFADMVADLNLCLKPRLYLMDGIIAMEGNGPASGNPVAMQVLLASADPVALDAVFAGLIRLDPKAVPTCVSGAAAGLGTLDYAQIEILTPEGSMDMEEAFARYGNPQFDVKRDKARFWRLSSLLGIHRRRTDRPVVDPALCIACGVCEEACPVDGKAVHSGNGKKAEYEYSKCIRCYCCQEMCPAKAIRRE